MSLVVLCGETSEITLKILREHVNVKVISDMADYCSFPTRETHVLLSKTVPNLGNTDSIIVFFDCFTYDQNSDIGSAISIINPNNTEAVYYLSRANKEAITCSTGARDTISVSSIENSLVSVSLLRTIKTIYGDTVETNDFIADIDRKKDLYEQIAAYACLLLLGINFHPKNMQ